MAPNCADIFKTMPERFNAEAAGDWETKIQFNIAGDGGGNWALEVTGGTCNVTEGTVEAPKATLNTDAETWVGMQTGTVNPMQAFMGGKIKVQGNMGELMKLNNPSVFRQGA